MKFLENGSRPQHLSSYEWVIYTSDKHNWHTIPAISYKWLIYQHRRFHINDSFIFWNILWHTVNDFICMSDIPMTSDKHNWHTTPTISYKWLIHFLKYTVTHMNDFICMSDIQMTSDKHNWHATPTVLYKWLIYFLNDKWLIYTSGIVLYKK